MDLIQHSFKRQGSVGMSYGKQFLITILAMLTRRKKCVTKPPTPVLLVRSNGFTPVSGDVRNGNIV